MEIRTAFRGSALSKGVAVVITVLTALMFAAGAIAGSGQVKDVRAAVQDLKCHPTGDCERHGDVVELTYTGWFTPAMTGVVGGDIGGTFGGSVVSTPIPNTAIVRLQAIYVITATEDPSQSFIAILKGKLNPQTNSAVLNGMVTSGFLTGERVHSEFQVVGSCPLNPGGPCFPGTMRISGASERE